MATINAKDVAEAILGLYNDAIYRKRLQDNVQAQSNLEDWQKIEGVFIEN